MKRLVANNRLLGTLIAASVALTACGGGGDNNGGSPTVNNAAPVKPTPAHETSASAPKGASATAPAVPATPVTPASGTGTSGNSQTSTDNDDTKKTDNAGGDDTPPPAQVMDNTVPIVVDNGVGRVVNMPYVSVTVCIPGKQDASQCTSVDHMLLDTGSVGVRVIASALGAAFADKLPLQTGASNDSTGKAAIAQCALFASGYTWGSTRAADITIGRKTASGIPIQLIGDNAFAATPTDCSSRGSAMNTVGALGANGIVGIGHLAQDYPDAARYTLAANYYYCPTPSSCTAARVPLNRQTANPVAAFATDNNGSIIRLPMLPSQGRASVTGELVFGIGTRDNNALPSWPTLLAVSDRGAFTSNYKGRTMTSLVDSGSNALFFPDASLPVVDTGWYAPAVTQSLNATMMSNTGNAQLAIGFSIANAPNLFDLGYAAHDNLGAPASAMFIWGLPFFYGRNVYTALSGAQAGTQTGPYVAF